MTGTDRAASAWRSIADAADEAFVALMEATGTDDPLVRMEGVRHLTRLFAAGALIQLEDFDPHYPYLVQNFSASLNWAVPCPDGLYHYAPLDAEHEYLVSGPRGTAHVFGIEVYAGDYDDAYYMKLHASGSDFEAKADGSVAVTLSREPRDGNWLSLPEGPGLVMTRQFFYDWENEVPARLTIERIGAEYPPPPTPPDLLAKRCEAFARFLRCNSRATVRVASMHYNADPGFVPFQQWRPEDGVDSEAGFKDQLYGQGYYRCTPEQAVILEVEPPTCRYWGFHLVTNYYEHADWLTRSTSINGHQAFIGEDGVFRAVIAHRDPGVPNWLDAGGHQLGLISGRYNRPDVVRDPTLRVVPFDAVKDALPTWTPVVTPEQRQDELHRRYLSVQRRFQ